MQHVDHLLSAYMDNELEEQERVIVEKHLQDCSNCLKLYEDFSQMSTQIMRGFEIISFPEKVTDQLMTRINQLETQDSQENVSILSYTILRWSAISSILLLLVVNLSLILTFSSLFSFTSIRILYHLVHGLYIVLSAIPFVSLTASCSWFLLIGISLWSLRQLLRSKKVETTQ